MFWRNCSGSSPLAQPFLTSLAKRDKGERSAARIGADGYTLAGRRGIERNEEDIGKQLKKQALRGESTGSENRCLEHFALPAIQKTSDLTQRKPASLWCKSGAASRRTS